MSVTWTPQGSASLTWPTVTGSKSALKCRSVRWRVDGPVKVRQPVLGAPRTRLNHFERYPLRQCGPSLGGEIESPRRQGALTSCGRRSIVPPMAINSGEPRRAMDRVMFRSSDPLKGLGDIRTVRGYLEEREIDFVKAARQWGKSWAEIAASIGTSRQAAWERWQELDSSS